MEADLANDVDGADNDDGMMQEAGVTGVEGMTSAQQPLLNLSDHFTLQRPTSDVRYRGNSVHVYDLRTSQIQLVATTTTINKNRDSNDDREEDVDEEILDGSSKQQQIIQMKDVQVDRGTALSLLRLTYTLVALFFAGILFSFSFLVILFLFMDLVADAGLTGGQDASVTKFIGTLLAIPIVLYGLCSLLTVAGFFVMQAWLGFTFLHTVGNQIDEVSIEWVNLLMMLGIPITAMIVALFAKSDDWWAIAFYTWFSSVSIYFVAFTLVVIYYETQAAWLIVHELGKESDTGGGDKRNIASQIRHFLGESIFRKQNSLFSGKCDKVRLGDEIVPSHQCCNRWYTSLTLSKCCCWLFEAVDPPERIYTMEEIFGRRRFVTRHNWSMEKILCSNRKNQNVVIVRGPSALKQSQIMSSIVCVFVTVIGVVLLVLAFMIWTEQAVGTIVVFLLIIICCCFPRFQTIFRFFRVYRKLKKEKENDIQESAVEGHENLNDGIYQTFETYWVSRPSKSFRVLLFLLNIGLCFVWPIVALAYIGNYPLLGLFIVMGIWSYIRYFLDPCVLLQKLGSFDVIGKSENERKWRVQSRVSTIMINVTRSQGKTVWMWLFLIIIFAAFAFAVASLGYQSGKGIQTTDVTDDNYYVQQGINQLFWAPLDLTPLGDFAYPPQPNLQYPTCQLFQGLGFPNGNSTALADYAFLATLIYQAPETLQETLDEWFGPGVATIESNVTAQFRENVAGGLAAVNYNIVSFGSSLAVVLVRGSSTSWEWLTDAQLWAAVALVQVFQFLLPAGEIFNPILDGVLKATSWVESQKLKEIALYAQTTQLVEYMRTTAGFNGSIHITGQSLGGGIALITGAQTNIPAIAISGPNNVFSRLTFDPPLDLDTIDAMLFNVIPERDIVPRVDQPGLLTQHIACRAKKSNLFDCHTSTRTLCEIMYKCGSYNRPPPCECAVKYGYPEANQIGGNQTYSDVCGTKRSNDGWYA